MKIINKLDCTVGFSDLKVGECFMYAGELYMKMHPVSKDANARNAFSLTNNCVIYVRDSWQVTPVVGEVIIRRVGVDEE